MNTEWTSIPITVENKKRLFDLKPLAKKQRLYHNHKIAYDDVIFLLLKHYEKTKGGVK